MPFAKTVDGKIYYEIAGRGPALVLVRGLGCVAAHWVGWERRLTKNYQVITLDNRGLGQSTVPIRPWQSMSIFAADIKTILKTERIQKAHIAGVSLGGMIALQFGLDFPESTISLTAINSSIGDSGHIRMTIQALQFLAKSSLKGKPSYETLSKLLTSANSSVEARSKVYTEWREIDSRHPNPATAVASQLAIALRWKPWRRFTELKTPVHIICGDDDRFVARGNSLFLSEKIPNAKLTTIASCGHEPHLERPDELQQVMEDFYRSIPNQ